MTKPPDRAAVAEGLFAALIAFDADALLQDPYAVADALDRLPGPEAAFIASLNATPTPYTPENWLRVAAQVTALIVDIVHDELHAVGTDRTRGDEAWLSHRDPYQKAHLGALATAAFFHRVDKTTGQ